ncbi:MAG: CCA-adding enzyme [Chlamydiae bacterium]|nr:CCA-adding enzyme [Chlamydiota bacterium]
MNKEALALSICETLQKKGYLAYFAGGYVRDKILQVPSDDIDIATDASPETIQSLFSKTIPLGIAFGIIMVIEQNHSFEVATFRKDLRYEDGRRPQEVAFCSAEEDAQRRDFTINGMFYNPLDQEVIDYVSGEEDLKKGIIRAIGDPFLRFEEDKLRLIRACRFAAKLNFKIDGKTEQAMLAEASSFLISVSIERVTQELKKMAHNHFDRGLKLLFNFNLLQEIFPSLKHRTRDEIDSCLSSFKHMPKDTPMVLFLLELFPKLSSEQQIEWMESLKLSNEDIKVASFCLEGRKLYTQAPPLKEWVYFYAHPYSKLCQKVIAARFSDEKRKKILEENHSRELKLKAHIERKKANKPLITSAHLMQHGVSAGKKLGELLKKAEEIIIEYDLTKPEEAIEMLKKTSIWKA